MTLDELQQLIDKMYSRKDEARVRVGGPTREAKALWAASLSVGPWAVIRSLTSPWPA